MFLEQSINVLQILAFLFGIMSIVLMTLGDSWVESCSTKSSVEQEKETKLAAISEPLLDSDEQETQKSA